MLIWINIVFQIYQGSLKQKCVKELPDELVNATAELKERFRKDEGVLTLLLAFFVCLGLFALGAYRNRYLAALVLRTVKILSCKRLHFSGNWFIDNGKPKLCGLADSGG